MSKVDELIKEFCPKGVKFVKFTDLGTFENIGVDKKIVNGEKSVKLLNYMDVYKNHYIDASIPTMTVTASDAKISKCSVEAGDIFITPTSETRDDIGHSAVATETIEGAVYSYHIMRFRLFKPEMVTSFFLNYVFESGIVQKQILKAAQGMTRYGVSAKKFSEFSIPIPPFEVQKEIVNILDKFTQLEVELSAELDARRKQYEYYRSQLLTFDENEVPFTELGEVYKFQYGKGNTIPTAGGEYPVYGSNGVVGSHHEFNSEDAPVIGHIGAYAGIVNWGAGKHFVTYNGVICKIKSGIDDRFGYHLLMKQKLRELARDGSQPFVSYDKLNSVKVQIPDVGTQRKIAKLLDNFDLLINGNFDGLPAEINARHQQYEYYRTKLLTFQELSV